MLRRVVTKMLEVCYLRDNAVLFLHSSLCFFCILTNIYIYLQNNHLLRESLNKSMTLAA